MSPKAFDRSRYAPLLTELLDAALSYNRQPQSGMREEAWNRVMKARLAIVDAEDDLKQKANKLEANLTKYDRLPEEDRPSGYKTGQQNWLALLETMEMLWAGRKCIELLMPWSKEPE